MEKPVLPKLWAWIILVILALLDSSMDMLFTNSRGLQGFLWKPVADFFGIQYAIMGVPFILVAFFIVVKFGTFLERKIEKIHYAEELVLTALVLAYGIFDLWSFSVYVFDFSLIQNHLYLIPILVVAATLYAWWAEKKLKASMK